MHGDEGDFYFRHAGCCTRCEEPFGGNRATAYMVRETIAWDVLGEWAALTQRETVPVCAACVTPDEEARSTVEETCVGCGLAMRSRFGFLRVCSNRCYQRELRARRRERARGWCASCGKSFKPKRKDGRYCSPACKQRAYRSRLAASAA
jgi:hypothetical protein